MFIYSVFKPQPYILEYLDMSFITSTCETNILRQQYRSTLRKSKASSELFSCRSVLYFSYRSPITFPHVKQRTGNSITSPVRLLVAGTGLGTPVFLGFETTRIFHHERTISIQEFLLERFVF